MRLIINEIFELENFDSEKLAKYIRCVFQATISLDDAMAMEFLNQAIEVATESQHVSRLLACLPMSSPTWLYHAHLSVSKTRHPFPHAELEWLIASSFNHAIDLYARKEAKETCHQWALKAMDLARLMNDAGAMGRILEERLAKLVFEH